MTTELYTRADVASIFSVDVLTVRNWEKSGKLKVALYINRYPRYSIDEVSKLASEKPSTNEKNKPAENA